MSQTDTTASEAWTPEKIADLQAAAGRELRGEHGLEESSLVAPFLAEGCLSLLDALQEARETNKAIIGRLREVEDRWGAIVSSDLNEDMDSHTAGKMGALEDCAHDLSEVISDFTEGGE